jgi:3-oxoacyl-[acyl-carrier protein] reductase
MDLGLDGSTVLVTGASGGIGRALAEAFGAEGARVVCHARPGEAALRAWLDGRPWKERSEVAVADIRDPAAMDALFDGLGRVDVCIANAGARPAGEARLDECADERVRGTVESNLLGAIWTARGFLRSLARTGGEGASLLLIGSTAASFGERGFADYAAAKAGLLGLMLSLKNEIVALDPAGRVNLIEPGWTATHVPRPALEDKEAVARVVRTMPLRRLARADDIARAALWVSSPRAAAHVTGQVLKVAGGMEGRILWDPGEVDPETILRRARGES